MRILVYGAGNIGSLYAARLAQSDADVTILARGQRADWIREHGLVLERAGGKDQTTAKVPVVECLEPEDAYDLVMVVLPKHRIADVLPVLAAHQHTPSLMFFCNNAAGPNELTDALGRERVLLGFPGAAAIQAGDVIRYVITSAREQPTTIGELDGRDSARVANAATALRAAGFPVSVSSNMDAWLKTHVAEILPTLCALYRSGCDANRLASSEDVLRLMVRSIREGYEVLRESGVPIEPANHRVFDWLPEALLLRLMKMQLRDEDAAIKLGHAEKAQAEWQLLASEFRALIERASVPTPAIDVLERYLTPTPAADLASEDLRRRIEEELARGGVPGCAIAFARHGAPDRTLVFGASDLDRTRVVTPTTRFHLFSGTKLYTAAALMLLVERGLVDLDASVLEYLPELALRSPVTVRQLASHASGLPDTLSGFLAVHFPGESAPSAREALQRYRLGRGRAPGGAAQYRNVNYAILGELVARVSGESFVEFMQREVLRPLGADLDFGDESPRDEANAVGYMSRFTPMRMALRIGFPEVSRRLRAGRSGGLLALNDYALDTAAIGGLVGSAGQFLPLLREMLSDEDGLLCKASKREMLTLQSEGAAGIVSCDGVGIGWKRGTTEGVRFWNHEGGGAGFCSETRLYPTGGLGIVVLMNRSQSQGLSRACHRICEAIRDAGRLETTP